ncbi:MAG TPA: SpoIIE family protein phosphatase, partial [Kribbella sp.]|nr:SpoIIE family protein phosphatase [Kribbella sp.]
GGRMLGRRVEEALPELTDEQILDRFHEVYETGVPFVARERRVQLPDADGVPQEYFVNFTYAPWRYDDGSMRGLVGSAQDVTEEVKSRRIVEVATAELRSQYEQACDTVTTLQRALLPTRLPVLPQLDLSARHLLAESDTAAGGDWFDTVVLDDGRVGLIVGDVVGHGVPASAVMGQLRSALAAYLLEGAAPDQAVTRLERFAARVPGAQAATVCVVLLDPATGSLVYCTAGHPPPLIASTIGQARYLEPSGGSPLGAPGRYVLGRDRLDVDDVLLLYTDGLIERPQRTPAQATVELLKATADAAAGGAFQITPQQPAERVTEQVLEILTRATGHTDDITVLAAHRRLPVEGFARTGPATVGTVAQWRDDLERWLRALDPETVVLIATGTAVLELTSNVVEHAYGHGATGELALTATLTADGDLEILVRDHGRWKDLAPAAESAESSADPVAGRGRGLGLAGALTDELTFDQTADGTTATARLALTKPTTMGAGRPRPAEPVEYRGQMLGRTLVVSGPIDISTARDFDHALRAAARHTTTALTIDLTEVTQLASAGVQVLAAALRRAEDSDHHLVLIAPPGTPAQHVLAVTNLRHQPGNTDT